MRKQSTITSLWSAKSLQCAVEWGEIKDCPPIKRLKTPPSKYDFLSVDECYKLTSAADGMWRAMIKVALGTGLRFGELIALSWEDIDFENNELTVRQAFAEDVLGSPKSNQIRYIPMSESVQETLKGMSNIWLKNLLPIKRLESHRVWLSHRYS